MDIEFIGVAPDVEELGLVGLKAEELLAESEHLVHLAVVIDRGIKELKIGLDIEVVSRLYGAGVLNACALVKNVCHTAVTGAEGVCVTDYLIADKLRELYSILLYLSDDLIVGKLNEIGVSEAVCSNLVSLIDAAYLLGREFIVAHVHALAQELTGMTEESGIDIKGALEAVLVKELNKSFVLCYTVIIAECYSFFLAVKVHHNYLT